MFPAEFITTERIALDVEAASKKRALETLADLLHTADQDMETIFDQLLERERLGSTGMGHGIALPHARVDGLDHPLGGFVRLSSAVDFGAIDGEPVDLVFGLVVPAQATQEHLRILAKLAELLQNPAFRNALRSSTNPQDLQIAIQAS